MAQEKDLGLQPFYLAGSLLQASQLSILPVTRPPITSAELREFALGLANRILDEQRPCPPAAFAPLPSPRHRAESDPELAQSRWGDASAHACPD